jgi:peroxiredoxin
MLSVFAVGCSSSPKGTPAESRKVAANFSLADSNGAQVTLADYKGKVVLLNFWATWCGPCKVEIPWFIEFNKTYKDRGFAVLGVSLDDDGWKSAKPYLAEKKIDYTVVVGNDTVSKSYGDVDSLPTTFIIDRDGRIAFVHLGLVGKDSYEKEIRNLLGGERTASIAD